MKKIRSFILTHKFWSTLIALVILFFIYEIYSRLKGTSAQTSYVVSVVQKGTIVSAVTGSGQVSASNQVDLTAKTSGNIISLPVSSGQEVKAGDLIIQIDARDAAAALESAKISFQKLTEPADAVSLLQAQNALADATQSKKTSEDNLIKAYDDGFSTVASAFLDIPDVVNGLSDLLYGQTGFLNTQNSSSNSSSVARQYISTAGINFDIAKKKYENNLIQYKSVTRTSPASSLESLIANTYDTVKTLTQAIKDSKTAVDFLRDQVDSVSKNQAVTPEANLSTWTDQINANLVSLLSAKNGIDNAKNAITSAEQSVRQQTESLTKIQSGADPLDIAAQRLNVQQKEYAYADAFLYAPFDGVIAKLNVQKTDIISSGTNIGTLITKQKIADISLNEIDAAKVKVGQKATLTFDAIDGLSISGQVVEVDLVGTVSQGVVTYNVKIGFDTQDDRVRSGMSVNASVITDVKQDVLSVPNSAVKSRGNASYVEIFNPPLTPASGTIVSDIPPTQQMVEVGVSNDTSTEIISGLNEGDQIVERTITATTQSAQTAPSLLGGGARGGAAGAIRGATGR